MTIMETIEKRKSIRGYLAKPIEKEKLDLILEAGRLAPSSRNGQSWKFVLVQDQALIKRLMPACAGQKFVGEAPAFLAVCATADREMMCGFSSNVVDCSIALSFMMLQAAELGIGTCWLGMYKSEEVREILNIPKDYNIVAVTPLGYPSKEGNVRSRKSKEEVVVYDDKWVD